MSLINSICITFTIFYGLWWILKFVVQETVYRKYLKTGPERFAAIFNDNPFKYFLIETKNVNPKTIISNLFFTILTPVCCLFGSTELVYLIFSKAEPLVWIIELPFIIASLCIVYMDITYSVERIKKCNGIGSWLKGYFNIMKIKIKK